MPVPRCPLALWWGQLLAGLSVALLHTASAEERPALSVTLDPPVNGTTYTGHVSVQIGISGGPNVPMTILVKGFGVTHHLHVEGRVELLDIMSEIPMIPDGHLPVTPGKHTVQVSVWSRDNAKLLGETQSTFTVVKPASLDAGLDKVRESLRWSCGLVPQAERLHWAASRAVRQGKEPPTALTEAEDRVLRCRREELLGRIAAFVSLAEVYSQGLEPERALRALQFAQEVFEKERTTAPIHPTRGGGQPLWEQGKVLNAPAHIAAFARHYTRLNDIEKAVLWWQQVAAWYEEQSRRPDLNEAARNSCRGSIAGAYEGIAGVHALLKNNLDECRAWRDKADAIRR